MSRALAVLIIVVAVAGSAIAAEDLDAAKRACIDRGGVFIEELDPQGRTVRWWCQ